MPQAWCVYQAATGAGGQGQAQAASDATHYGGWCLLLLSLGNFYAPQQRLVRVCVRARPRRRDPGARRRVGRPGQVRHRCVEGRRGAAVVLRAPHRGNLTPGCWLLGAGVGSRAARQ